jgi:hypothetical protein
VIGWLRSGTFRPWHLEVPSRIGPGLRIAACGASYATTVRLEELPIDETPPPLVHRCSHCQEWYGRLSGARRSPVAVMEDASSPPVVLSSETA